MTTDESIGQTAPPGPDAPAGGLFMPAALFCAAVLLLAAAAVVEERLIAREPWAEGVLCLDGETPAPSDALAVRARIVAREAPAPGDADLARLNWLLADGAASGFKADTPELAVAVSMPAEDLVPLLASGRLPAPGAPEALAGDLARDTPFALAGRPFTVVGRLRRNVSGFLFSYLILDDPALDDAFPDDGATVEGWAHPRGLTLVGGEDAAEETAGEETAPPAEDAASGDSGQESLSEGEEMSPDASDPATNVPYWQGGETRTAPVVAWACAAALLLAALSGYGLHTRLCRRWAATLPEGSFFSPLFREVAERPRLWAGMHAGLYALLFAALFGAMTQPLLAHRFAGYVGAVFAEGDLEQVGRAYAAGNVLEAAWFTWKNNFLVQTVLSTVLISLFPLALGVLKNASTFLLVGAGMAPLWTGRAGTYVFHVVTMILELEAYILASFCVTVWAVRVLSSFSRPPAAALPGLSSGARMLGAVVLYTGGVLGVAALYEAVTLISALP